MYNDYIMNEKVDMKKINNFDIIFNKMEYEFMNIDMMLFYIWNKEKNILKTYSKDNSFEIIKSINEELSLISKEVMIEAKLVKIKAILGLV